MPDKTSLEETDVLPLDPKTRPRGRRKKSDRKPNKGSVEQIMKAMKGRRGRKPLQLRPVVDKKNEYWDEEGLFDVEDDVDPDDLEFVDAWVDAWWMQDIQVPSGYDPLEAIMGPLHDPSAVDSEDEPVMTQLPSSMLMGVIDILIILLCSL